MNRYIRKFLLLFLACPGLIAQVSAQRPNIILVYADDLGYGDLSCYGAGRIHTPNIDALSAEGLRFTNAHATSATCTPSRYGILTGQYPWRKKGTGIARGNASLIIDTATTTLPAVMQRAGYKTAVVGKWHLGLGGAEGPQWNEEIKPGPLEIGFDYAYIMPATLDRVPTVFIEDHRIVNLDKGDPITVSYEHPVGREPIAAEHPELLKMQSAFHHNQAIVNGVGRIGYMTGGKSALWVDENIADSTTAHAIRFIEKNKNHSFFLYFATHDIHVPRLPHYRFAGKSGMGSRGDAILELDWTVGRITRALDSLHLRENTLIIFTSDNGPVLNDGYKDQAVELLNGHTPAGPLRGGKYSIFDAGTRVPFIVSWKDKVLPGSSPALVSQLDLFASLAALTGQSLEKQEGPDSFDLLDALLGFPWKASSAQTSPDPAASVQTHSTQAQSAAAYHTAAHPAGAYPSAAGSSAIPSTAPSLKTRPWLVEDASGLSIIKGKWKYIAPNKGRAFDTETQIELGNNSEPQLYDLDNDIGEHENLAAQYPELVRELSTLLKKIQDQSISSHP